MGVTVRLKLLEIRLHSRLALAANLLRHCNCAKNCLWIEDSPHSPRLQRNSHQHKMLASSYLAPAPEDSRSSSPLPLVLNWIRSPASHSLEAHQYTFWLLLIFQSISPWLKLFQNVTKQMCKTLTNPSWLTVSSHWDKLAANRHFQWIHPCIGNVDCRCISEDGNQSPWMPLTWPVPPPADAEIWPPPGQCSDVVALARKLPHSWT